MRGSILFGALAALVLSSAAHSETITILAPTVLAPPSGTVVTFDESGVPLVTYGLTTPSGSFTEDGVSFSGSGIVMNNFGGDSEGIYAQPFGDPTNYMAVLGGDSETISYSQLDSEFGLYWGSVDTYNSLEFYDGTTLVATVTGGEVAPLLADGGQGSYASNGYVFISGLPAFNSVVVSSSQNSFEFDNVTAGVPELTTWAMMLLGFAGLGFVGYRGTKKNTAAVATAR